MKPKFQEGRIDLAKEAKIIYDAILYNEFRRSDNLKMLIAKLDSLYNNVWMDGYQHGYAEALFELDYEVDDGSPKEGK